MSRSEVRDLKRVMRTGADPHASALERERARESALALLERSIKNRHDRLAIRRLAAAIRLGAAVTVEQWKYCEVVAATSRNAELLGLLMEAASAAGARTAHGSFSPLTDLVNGMLNPDDGSLHCAAGAVAHNSLRHGSP